MQSEFNWTKNKIEWAVYTFLEQKPELSVRRLNSHPDEVEIVAHVDATNVEELGIRFTIKINDGHFLVWECSENGEDLQPDECPWPDFEDLSMANEKGLREIYDKAKTLMLQ